MIAIGPMIGRYLPRSMATPSKTFQKILLPVNPAKALPLLALAEVTAYIISEKPWKPELFSHPEGLNANVV
jgi:hypothetical protein